VTPGEFYADAIVRALNEARILLLVLTEYAVASPHVLREVERTSAKRHPIISFRIDSVPLPPALEYFLSASHWLEATPSTIQSAFPKLVDAVQRLVAPVSTVVSASTADIQKPAAVPLRDSSGGIHAGRRLGRPVVLLSALTAAALTYLVVDRFWLSKHAESERPIASASPAAAPAAAISDRSVAVLPFVDMSEKKNQEYFSDGLTEELIDHLAHSANLKVISRTSSFQFKGKNEDVRTIGQRLGVANLLEGSVRTSGKTIRVTAQLIRVSDGSHFWSQAYDRSMGDIFKVQDSIATAVVTALQATLSQFPSSAQERSENIEAYNAMLRGRYFENKGTKQDSDRAIAAFEAAIRLDPRYATAWAALAKTYNGRGLAAWMSPQEAYSEARKAVDRALVIDPNLAEAHRMLGILEWNYQRDFAASQAEFNRFRELDPDNRAAILHDEALTAIAYGQFDKGVRMLQELTQIDPLDEWGLWVLTFGLSAADRLPEAERAARSLVELKPGAGGVHCSLGEVLLAERKPDEALAVMSDETDLDTRWCTTDALWALGRRAESDALLEEATRKYASSQAIGVAESYALRNDKDAAFKWLDRAYDNREPPVTLIKADPSLRNLHGDPRFSALLAKLKLPE